jgi:lipopolysaccharide export system permease protein
MTSPLTKSSMPQVQASVEKRGFSIPGLSIMDRYIVTEMLAPFAFGVAVFTALIMTVAALFELVRYMVENGMSLSTAFQIFILRMPGLVVLTFPMATLLATLQAFSRLSGDFEVIAMRACGVSIVRLITPILLVGVLITGATVALNEVIAPSATRAAALTLFRALNNKEPDFKKENFLYPQSEQVKGEDGQITERLTRIIHAKTYADGVMNGVKVVDLSEDNLSQIVVAKRAEWSPEKQVWKFQDGTTYIIAADGSYRNVLRFKEQNIYIANAFRDLANETRNPKEMNASELTRHIQKMRDSHQPINSLLVELYQKFSIPFTCMSFAFVGCLLGIRPQRTSGALGLGLSVLIIFAYYVILAVCQALGQTGSLPPIIAAWLPNLITLGVGGVLLWRTSR